MIPTELESKALLGKEATDLYGRHLGRVIGIDRTPFGEMAGVQIEAPGGNILTPRNTQVALTPRTVTVTPEGKLSSHETVLDLPNPPNPTPPPTPLTISHKIQLNIHT